MTEPQLDTPEPEPVHTACPAAPVKQCSRVLPWTTTGALICVFLIIDVLTTRCVRISQWLEVVLTGLCIGQINLIAVWTSLAPGNIVLRMSWSLLLTIAMWYALILGDRRLPFPHITRSDAVMLILVLLASVVVMQVPLWIAKKVFRWRLTRRPDDTQASLQEDRQFNLKHLLIAMLLLSVALSPLQQILPPGTVPSLSLDREYFVLLPAAILCNLLIALPCIWWAFTSTATLVRLLFGWLFYCATISAIAVMCICALIKGPAADKRLEAILGISVFNLSQCIAVLATLLIIRALGFRMVRTPRQPTTPIA